jgi:hypothetical protein
MLQRAATLNMLRQALAAVLLATLLGCASTPQPERAPGVAPATLDWRSQAIDVQIEERILALDPQRVSDSDVRQLLALGPTPRIVNLHGGIYPVHLVMESFARFLAGMGYPQAKLRHPGDGRQSHSPYEDSRQIAGLLAWYYENEGLMPMLVGHSQGGIQLIKVLYVLAGSSGEPVRVWDPMRDQALPRTTLVDPYSGLERPVVGLKVGYAAVVGSGGAALLLPNQWGMVGRLQRIPDSVGDFTGYALEVDLIAWDLPGATANYRPLGTARVRNVPLPAGYSHVFVAATSHLARDPALRAWINDYVPGTQAPPPADDTSATNLLFAADVWYSIKQHWVLQAQSAIRARRAAIQEAGPTQPPAPGSPG